MTGSQVYPICGLSVGQKPNFIHQMFKAFSGSLPQTFSIDFPNRKFSIGEPLKSDVVVPKLVPLNTNPWAFPIYSSTWFLP